MSSGETLRSKKEIDSVIDAPKQIWRCQCCGYPYTHQRVRCNSCSGETLPEQVPSAVYFQQVKDYFRRLKLAHDLKEPKYDSFTGQLILPGEKPKLYPTELTPIEQTVNESELALA